MNDQLPEKTHNQGSDILSDMSAEDRTKMEKLCRDCDAEMEIIEDERAVLNARANTVRDKLRAVGLNPAAWAAARQYQKTDETRRVGFDVTYALARASTGKPVQFDLGMDGGGDAPDGEESAS